MSYQPQSPESSTTSAGIMPSSVSLAQKLVYLYVALAAISTLLAFIAREALVDAFLEARNVPSELRGRSAATRRPTA